MPLASAGGARGAVMNRFVVALVLLMTLPPLATAAGKTITGSWTVTAPEKPDDRLELSMRFGRHENSGNRLTIGDFSGLSAAQMRSATQVDVAFELRREAGTVAYQGLFKAGNGAGTFTFSPNEDYLGTLRKLGVEFEDHGNDVDQQLLTLALFDVSSSFVRSMQDIGYKVSAEKYISFRIFSVDPAYVRDMASVGFDHLPADKLIETRIHGATPDYIRQMRKSGDDVPLDKYIESRIFQITPEFAAEMSRAGYPNLDRDELVQFKIQGVTPEFISELKSLGYTKIPAEKLVEMRIHGVTPDYIRRVEAAGYKHVPIDKMVQMRIFDIQPEMIRALDDAKGGT
jgi:hypothetical protein